MIMNQTVPQQPGPKERAKASFGIVDEMLKAYNGGETYVKRFLTFVGIGGVITGTTLGYVSPQAPQTQPIIIQTTPPSSLPAASPAEPESSPAKPVESSTTQPVAEIQPKSSQTPPSQPKVRPASSPKPVIATQPAPSPVTVQKPPIVISPPTLKSPVPSLPIKVDQSDQDDKFEIDD